MTFQAQSDNDDTAPVSETSISLQLEASAAAGGLGGGLEEVDKDTLVMYGSIGAAVLFGLIFVVALARTLRRRANAQPTYVPPVEVRTMRTRTTSLISPNWTICSPMTKRMSSTTFSPTSEAQIWPLVSTLQLGRCDTIS